LEENKIPIIRHIISFGKTSKGIILPKSWLDFLEKKHGNIYTVAIEVNGKLTISPILEEMAKNQRNSG